MIWRSLEDVLVDGRGTERAFQCHVHDDNHASASVNVDLGVWICYACGAKGSVEGHVPDPKSVIRALSEDAPARQFPEEWLDLFDAHHPSDYWTDRVGAATAEHFRCGTHPQSGAPTYPLRNLSGTVLGVVVRNADEEPKYRYPYGPRTSQTFFSSDNRLTRKPVVVLVEGAPDVMALHQAGLPGHWQALGCFGAGLHMPQIEALADINPKLIIAGFDADKAGRLATERAEIQCAELAPVVSVPWDTFESFPGDRPAKDAADVPLEERINVISKALHHHQYERFL